MAGSGLLPSWTHLRARAVRSPCDRGDNRAGVDRRACDHVVLAYAIERRAHVAVPETRVRDRGIDGGDVELAHVHVDQRAVEERRKLALARIAKRHRLVEPPENSAVQKL